MSVTVNRNSFAHGFESLARLFFLSIYRLPFASTLHLRLLLSSYRPALSQHHVHFSAEV